MNTTAPNAATHATTPARGTAPPPAGPPPPPPGAPAGGGPPAAASGPHSASLPAHHTALVDGAQPHCRVADVPVLGLRRRCQRLAFPASGFARGGRRGHCFHRGHSCRTARAHIALLSRAVERRAARRARADRAIPQ